jgi:DNA-binding MarR family transcriptional regulator
MSRRTSDVAFAPIPMRALSDERLSTIHYRALGAIAYRDGLGRNKQGCWASPQDLAELCRVNDKNMITAISDLVTWGYASREPRPDDKRKRVYRVLYTEDDRIAAKIGVPRVANASSTRDEIGSPQATKTAEIGCPEGRDRLPGIANFPCDFNAPTPEDNLGKRLRETQERHSAEAGTVPSELVPIHSGHAGRLLGKVERDATARGYMTESERDWCDGICEAFAHTGDPVGGMAYRLVQTGDDEFKGRRSRRSAPEMTPEEFERRRWQMLRDLEGKS